MNNYQVSLATLLALSLPGIVQAAEYQLRLDDINLEGNAIWKAWLKREFGGKAYTVNNQDDLQEIQDARRDFINAGIEVENDVLHGKGSDQESYERFLKYHGIMQTKFNKLKSLVATKARRVR
jgi:hypothetical protein